MKLLDVLEKLEDIIKNNFYENLLKGNINGAKKTTGYMASLMPAINKELNDIAKNLKEHEIAGDFEVTRKELQKKFIELISLIDKELKNIDNKIFQEDPALWQGLLKETFQEPTTIIIINIHKLYDFFAKLKKISTEESVPSVATEQYKKIKYKKKVYSDNLSTIYKAERKICRTIFLGNFYNRKITGKIKSGPWEKFYHIHLPMPLGDHRIVYLWDGKQVIFYTIGTHKELGIS